MLSNYRCVKAPAPEKYQPCSLPVCYPGKCQNRCFQIVYKNKQTDDKGPPGWPPHAQRRPGVWFDGCRGETLEMRGKKRFSFTVSTTAQWVGGRGPKALSLGSRHAPQTTLAAEGRREGWRVGGRHGWIWVPATKQWKNGNGGTGEEGGKGKHRAGMKLNLLSSSLCASCCAGSFCIYDLVSAQLPCCEMGAPILQMRKLSPELTICTDTQAAAVRIPASSVRAPNRALSTLPQQQRGQGFTLCKKEGLFRGSLAPLPSQR